MDNNQNNSEEQVLQGEIVPVEYIRRMVETCLDKGRNLSSQDMRCIAVTMRHQEAETFWNTDRISELETALEMLTKAYKALREQHQIEKGVRVERERDWPEPPEKDPERVAEASDSVELDIHRWTCPKCGSVWEWDAKQSFVDRTAPYCGNCAPKPPAFHPDKQEDPLDCYRVGCVSHTCENHCAANVFGCTGRQTEPNEKGSDA